MPVNGSEKVAFEYIELLSEYSLLYKVTYKNTIRYITLSRSEKGSVITESGVFRVN